MFTNSINAILMTSALVGMVNAAPGDEWDTAYSDLGVSGRRVIHIRLLSKAYSTEDIKGKQLISDFRVAKKKIQETKDELARIEREALEDFQSKFKNLHALENPSWRIAVHNGPLLDELPKNVDVSSNSQISTIHKSARSDNYHLCLGVPFEDGDRALITFSLPLSSVRGGTPVPYFGLRGSEGVRTGLCHLSHFNGDGKRHTLLVERIGDEGLVVIDGQIPQTILPGRKELPATVYVFFHMNDESRIVIHDIQLSGTPESETAANE